MFNRRVITVACAMMVCLALVSQAQPPNLALNGTATSSSTAWGWLPEHAIDGNLGTGSHSADNDPDKWLEVELDQAYTLKAIVVHNRASCCWERIAGVVVKALDADRNEIYVSDPIAADDALQGSVHSFDNDGAGFADVRYIRLEGGTNFLQIMEIEAFPFWPYASYPAPANLATGVIDAVLNWEAPPDSPAEAPVYDVYFGTDVDALEVIAESIVETSINVGSTGAELNVDTTYYWRVDSDGVEGLPWSFTTEPLAFAIEGVIATSDAATGDAVGEPQQTVDGSGLNENDEHNTESMDMWLGVPAAGEAVSIQYEFPRVYMMNDMMAWNSNTGFEGFLGYGFKDVTVEYSVDGAEWIVLADVEFAQAPGTEGYAANTIVDFGGVAAQYVKLTANTNWGGLFPDSGLSEVRFTYIPAQARIVAPTDSATGVAPDAVLDWYAGRGAVSHDVYLNDELVAAVEDSSFAPDLVYGMPYTWKVDENDGVNVWEGDVWSFTTVESGTVLEAQTLVYDEAGNEAEQILDPAADLTAYGADTLQVSYRGNPKDYAETDGIVAMSASGADIWGNSDQFRYAYQSLTGDGEVIARVDSIDNVTNTWAKAGVMIRQSNAPGSTHAFACITGSSGGGASFQRRTVADSGSDSNHDLPDGPFAPPYWVKVARVGNDLTGSISADGETWVQAGDTVTIEMTDPVLIGLALTSHDGGSYVVAQYSEISGVGDITGDVTVEAIGMDMPSNDAAGLYVTVEDGAGQATSVVSPDDRATNAIGTQNWGISLATLADAGIDLTNVAKITVGAGAPDAPAAGSGTVALDAITVGVPVAMFSEDFEGLPLGPNVDEGLAGDAVWTKTAPGGWSIDDSGMPGVGDPAADGVTEWAGWSFADKAWWTETAGDQDRSLFTLGTGTVAIADPDEWDDADHAEGFFNSFLTTPAINVSNVVTDTLQLTFASSWRPEFDDDYHQTANITVSFDGGEPVEVLLWESDSSSPNFKDYATNETVTVEISKPAGAQSMVLAFGLFDAGNDWWWAIDNVQVIPY